MGLLLGCTGGTTNSPELARQTSTLLDGGNPFCGNCGDTQTDPNNCGACGNVCALANATAQCIGGACAVQSCNPGFGDTDGLARNGCETACPGADGGTDVCDGVDNDCNGVVDDGYSLQTDLANCGACGNACGAGAPNAVFSCDGGCVFEGCKPGFTDPGGAHTCTGTCTYTSPTELCNGIDDNCDGQIDEGVVPPNVSDVCGVSGQASTPECTTQVTVACVNGAWKCTFPAGVCNPTCAAAAEICDGLDNNCNGLINENVPQYGQPCASDDGKPPPGDGACRTTGTFVCNGPTAVKCSAVKDLTKAGPELCDGADNDCDGLIDEPFTNKGTNATYFAKPVVTKIANSLWIDSYESSRPNAAANNPGNGNGYYSATAIGTIPAAPVGVTLDKTPACSVPGALPWASVTPIEAEQTCNARGGHLCTTAEWQTACVTNPPSATTCAWAYAPLGVACTTALGPPYPVPFPTTGSKFCNLGPTYDYDSTSAGDQDGVLSTGSSALKNCYADWTALLGNTANNGKIFDLTGNLREITKQATNVYVLMGGSNLTQDESGARCQFTNFAVDQNFSLYDTGFRCCYSQDPTL